MLRLSTAVTVLLFVSLSLYAQKRIYTTHKITGEPPRIDGIFNDPAWNEVKWSGDFVQLQPYENKPPSQKTQFKILYDNYNLYVAIRAFDTAPDSIVKRMSRRDGFDGDWVEINIDSYHDLRSAFSFTVNAAGVKGDEAITNDNNWYADWDPIWYVKTAIDSLGWTAEMRIPLTQLRFGKQESYTWGLQVNRRLFRKQERSSWVFISPNAAGWVHYFGELKGIKDIKPKKQFDLVPYSLGRFEHYQPNESNPFLPGHKWSGSAGLDGKIGITNDFTLDFTINPDFGQVEADPSEVNLTTFETKFPEKRAFFIEGRDKLSQTITGGDGPLSGDNLFYSRRIGHHPTRSLPDSIYSDIPANTTILGAFKLTGKTRKGLSLGAMESVTAREMARTDYNGVRGKEEVEPLTNYFAARVQQDLNDANTRIGGMITSTNRDLSNPDLAATMHNQAYTGGFNFNQQWKNQTYYFNLVTVFSQIRGSKAAMYKAQTSAPFFFQRPDAPHLHVDSTRTHIEGFGGTVEFGKAGNGNWVYTTWVTWRSPGLNLNDIGYMLRNDEIQQIIWVGYRKNQPFSIFRNFGLNLNQWYGATFGGEKRYVGGNVNAYWNFKNYWGMNGGIERDGKGISTETLRGGPALLYDGGTSGWINMSTDSRKKIQLYGGYNAGTQDKRVTYNENFYFGMNLHISDAFVVSMEPGFSHHGDKLAYVKTLDDRDPVRYIRGNLTQKQVQMIVRFTYNITPDFTIQYYGMPFISAGKYKDFSYISNSKASDFNDRFVRYDPKQISYNKTDNIWEVDENTDGTTDYTFNNPNFNVFDFNSNLVVRWEYQPGSILYLVWTESRNDSKSTGDFNFGNDVKDLFDTFPHDVFLIKLSYRIGL